MFISFNSGQEGKCELEIVTTPTEDKEGRRLLENLKFLSHVVAVRCVAELGAVVFLGAGAA